MSYSTENTAISFSSGGSAAALDLSSIQTTFDATVIGGTGRDTLLGGWGNDYIAGLGGADVIYGRGGNDYLDGGSGHDRLFGGYGDDEAEGGRGNDTFDGGAGFDAALYRLPVTSAGTLRPVPDTNGDTLIQTVVNGQAINLFRITKVSGGWQVADLRAGSPLGTDFVANSVEHMEFFTGMQNVSINLKTRIHVQDNAPLLLKGGISHDTINVSKLLPHVTAGTAINVDGNTGNDLIVGHAGENALEGGYGRDTLFGGAAPDYLSGGAGDDILYGGSGNDYLEGGGGQDTHVGGSGFDISEWNVYFNDGGRLVRVNSSSGVIIKWAGPSGTQNLFRITQVEGGFQVKDLRPGSPLGRDFITPTVDQLGFLNDAGNVHVYVKPQVFITGSDTAYYVGSAGSDVLDTAKLIPGVGSTTYVTANGETGNENDRPRGRQHPDGRPRA